MKFLIILFLLVSCSHKRDHLRDISSDTKAKTIELFEKTNNKKRNYRINFDKLLIELEKISLSYKDLLTMTVLAQHDGEDIYRIDLHGNAKFTERQKVIITSGIHGDESIAIGAMIDFIHLIVKDPYYRNHFDFTFIPYLNPHGIKRNSRYLRNGKDLNRSFKNGLNEVPTTIFKHSVTGETFDLALDLHEAHTKSGFFVIKADKNDKLISRKAIIKMPKHVIFSSPDGKYPYKVQNSKNPKKFSYTLHAPGETVSFNPGTLKGYFKTHLGAKYAYTVEAPGKMKIENRLDFYVDFIKEIVNSYKLNK